MVKLPPSKGVKGVKGVKIVQKMENYQNQHQGRVQNQGTNYQAVINLVGQPPDSG